MAKVGNLMATAEQVKSLIKAFSDNDKEKFKTVSLQIAAYEALHGHEAVARDIKRLIDGIGQHKSVLKINTQNQMLENFLPTDRMNALVVSQEIKEKLERIINEYRNRNKLAKFGLCNRRRILLEGKPGTGKTFTASVIAGELGLPLYVIQMDKIITKFMGETSVKLRQIFDDIKNSQGVFLFDEFDALGADRNFDNEVGEARRILNSFLQFVEQDFPNSIVVAATNNQKLLDQALFRRFDDVLHYALPDEEQIRKIFDITLKDYSDSFLYTEKLIEAAKDLCHAEIINACNDAIKESILNDKELTEVSVVMHLGERTNIYGNVKGA